MELHAKHVLPDKSTLLLYPIYIVELAEKMEPLPFFLKMLKNLAMGGVSAGGSICSMQGPSVATKFGRDLLVCQLSQIASLVNRMNLSGCL